MIYILAYLLVPVVVIIGCAIFSLELREEYKVNIQKYGWKLLIDLIFVMIMWPALLFEKFTDKQ